MQRYKRDSGRGVDGLVRRSIFGQSAHTAPLVFLAECAGERQTKEDAPWAN